MSYFDLLFYLFIIFITMQAANSVSFQVVEILPNGNENNKLYNEYQMQNTYFKIDLGCLRIQTWEDAGFQFHL